MLPASGQAATHVAMIDSGIDTIIVTDKEGNFIRQACGTAAFGSMNPQGVVFLPESNEFAIVDSSADKVFIFNATNCGLNRQFDTARLGIEDPSGIGLRQSTGNFPIVDRQDSALYIVDALGDRLLTGLSSVVSAPMRQRTWCRSRPLAILLSWMTQMTGCTL